MPGRKKITKRISSYNMMLLEKDEFNQACNDIKLFLTKRAVKAMHASKTNRSNTKKLDNYIRLSKEAYAFTRLVEMCTYFSNENMTLHKIILSLCDAHDNIGDHNDVLHETRDPTKFN